MDRKELLLKVCWSSKDIQEYFGCGSTKAYKIKEKALKIKRTKYSTKYVDSNTILSLFNSSREEELKLLTMEEKK